jgi:hypothetical protein
MYDLGVYLRAEEPELVSSSAISKFLLATHFELSVISEQQGRHSPLENSCFFVRCKHSYS